ncbi:hypothetical protein [Flavobacterium sp. UBA7663]|uniref:hypothetical protein n=1 Tax=Flavobacterium sp. UBA7663 TaxID=1946557 RepID=UPI0025BCEB43|nr:hypothetical protein [Flavobacterium sp. UBA7663]
MDHQYFPHRHISDLERLFKAKNTALIRLKTIGFDCPYISSSKTYEQLYLDEVQKDFNFNELDFLREGILYIFECLKMIENEVAVDDKYSADLVLKECGDVVLRMMKSNNFKEGDDVAFLSQVWQQKNKKDNDIKSDSIYALSRELAEFKVRLSRLGIETVIRNDEIEFLDLRFPIPEPTFDMIDIEPIDTAEPETENPFPEIFMDFDAYTLFNRWHSVFQNSKTKLADYSFIYRIMESEGLILESKPLRFQKWLNGEPYKADIEDMFKTYDNCKTEHKVSLYQMLKTIR